MNSNLNKVLAKPAARIALAAGVILASLWLIQWSVVFGASRLFVKYALSVRDQVVANEAVRMTPLDAEAHYASAVVMGWYNATSQDAVISMERAVAVRPRDYTMWMQLGLSRDQSGDTVGAIAALDEAVRLAPFYAKPRWLRGNVLLRAGQTQAGIDDLRSAVASDPELIPAFVDLAVGLSRGDSNLAEQLIASNHPKARLAFARMLVKQGKAKEAVEQFRLAGDVQPEIRGWLVNEMLAKEEFAKAFELWKGEKPASNHPVYDGGFEGTLSFDESGFGWRVARSSSATSASLETENPHSGEKSLRIEFQGNFAPPLFQLVLLKPSKTYRLNFAVRTINLVTGGAPLVTVQDASSGKKILGQSAAVTKGTSDWQTVSFQFTTLPTTGAVIVSLQRENCPETPCPIFGAILLDSFSIEEVS